MLGCKKLVKDAQLPTRNLKTDAGLDIYSNDNVFLPLGKTMTISTGIAIEVPEGLYAEIKTRSSMARNGVTTLGGVVDTGYTGEVSVVLHNLSNTSDYINGQYGYAVRKGDRIAQLVYKRYEHVAFMEVVELPESERGSNSFGSSGK